MNFDNSIVLIRLALDACLLRQKAIANNIANINSINYQTMEVNFEQQLDQLSSDYQSVHPFLQPSISHSPPDEQLALAVKNATHYRALIKGLNQKLALMKLALQGNNQL